MYCFSFFVAFSRVTRYIRLTHIGHFEAPLEIEFHYQFLSKIFSTDYLFLFRELPIAYFNLKRPRICKKGSPSLIFMIFKVEDINDTKAVERLGPEKNVYHMNNYAVVSQRTKGKFASKLLKGSRTGVILFTSKYLAHYKWAY